MTIPEILAAINHAMHEGSACPTAGCIGECAAITEQTQPDRYAAHIYLWANEFNDSGAVARWFIDLGAIDIHIVADIYEPENGVYNGRAPDGARPWHVLFTLPGVAHGN